MMMEGFFFVFDFSLFFFKQFKKISIDIIALLPVWTKPLTVNQISIRGRREEMIGKIKIMIK